VRQRIQAAAKKEFAKYGLKGASVGAIAARAGVTPAMINYHFQGKLRLYHEVVKSAIERLMSHLSRALASSDDLQLPVRLAGAYFDFLCTEQELQRLLMHEVLGNEEALPEIITQHLKPLRSILQERYGQSDATFQNAVSLFGAVAGYFLYAPVMAELLGADPLAPSALRRRRHHILMLAAQFSETTTNHQNKEP